MSQIHFIVYWKANLNILWWQLSLESVWWSVVYRSVLKADPRAARLQLELDTLSWSLACWGRRGGREGGTAHSRWSGHRLEDRSLSCFISEAKPVSLCTVHDVPVPVCSVTFTLTSQLLLVSSFRRHLCVLLLLLRVWLTWENLSIKIKTSKQELKMEKSSFFCCCT